MQFHILLFFNGNKFQFGLNYFCTRNQSHLSVLYSNGVDSLLDDNFTIKPQLLRSLSC